MSDENKQNVPNASPNPEFGSKDTVPVWLVAAFLILLFTSAWTFNERGGWFDAKVNKLFTSVGHVMAYQPRQNSDPRIPRGQKVFHDACAGCHDDSGLGKLGTAPPLVGSDWVNAPKPDRIIHIPLYGLFGPITVSGKKYEFANQMTPLGDALSDQQVSDVLTYIRQAWGNKAGGVTPEEVAAVRKLVGKHQPFNPEDLMKVPDR